MLEFSIQMNLTSAFFARNFPDGNLASNYYENQTNELINELSIIRVGFLSAHPAKKKIPKVKNLNPGDFAKIPGIKIPKLRKIPNPGDKNPETESASLDVVGSLPGYSKK